jgi:D-alanyl-D-alanine carboxypeptidase
MSINHQVPLSRRWRRVPAVLTALLATSLTVPGYAGVTPESPLAVGAEVRGAATVAGQAAGVVVAEPRVLARAAILADESTGQVLFERNARLPRAMASTTKVMTALLALERLDARRMVVIGPGPPRVGEESLRLRQGERLTVRHLLLGLMVKSANDAGVALAEAVDGTEAAFVRRMNRKAAALRLATTRYVTPYGLDRSGHQTSARDLARLWEAAMRRADFRSLVGTAAARLPGGPLSLRRFVTSNELLGSYRWTVGGKTGFTSRAGRCLVASAGRGGRRLVAVALGSPDAFADVRAMFEYGFSKFVRVRLASRGQPVSLRSGLQAAHQVDADTDALVRLDQLAKVRLATTPTPAGAGPAATTLAWFVSGQHRLVQVPLARLPAAGAAPTSTLVPATPTTGPAGAAPAPGPTAGAGSGGPSAPAPSAPAPSAPAPSAPAPSAPAPSGPGAAGPGPAGPGPAGPGATLIAGEIIRVGPVPRGAPAPTIDPFLRRTPP